jgi:hypothetical protein
MSVYTLIINNDKKYVFKVFPNVKPLLAWIENRKHVISSTDSYRVVKGEVVCEGVGPEFFAKALLEL